MITDEIMDKQLQVVIEWITDWFDYLFPIKKESEIEIELASMV
jgi:hypothetical protein